jgi:hypothetical protein
MTKATKHVAAKAGDSDTGLIQPGQPDPLCIPQTEGETRASLMARVALEPLARHASVAGGFASRTFGGGRPPIDASVGFIANLAAETSKGDLGIVSRTLTAQALSLDTIFAEMARRSADNMGQHLDASERYMRLALKAQSNCRATLETLAKLHLPREQTVRHVHVNNGGQAIVADQLHHHHGGQENGKSDGQPPALTRGTDAPCQPIRSANAERETVPIAREA